jgi:hypothetical protein
MQSQLTLGLTKKRLNEQVKRNADRVPTDFTVQLSAAEFASLKSKFSTSSWGGRRKFPLAFTEKQEERARREFPRGQFAT